MFMTPLTIYIAGKVSGEPIADCTIKFGTAQKQVQELGHNAINPLEVVNDWHATWETAMRKCVKALMDSDAILLLHDHRDSPGASLEGQLAETFKMPVFYSIKELRNYRPKSNVQPLNKQ